MTTLRLYAQLMRSNPEDQIKDAQEHNAAPTAPTLFFAREAARKTHFLGSAGAFDQYLS